MLETGSAPVDVIAREVGYEDSASFRRLFRRLAGMTPGDYRRRFQIPSFVKQATTERKPKRPRRAPKAAARRPPRDATFGRRDERAAPRH
jgi:hypothetical protein